MEDNGTDQRLGVSFDQQDGSAVGGWTKYGVIGAYADTARHAVKCAEWCRTQNVAWRSSPRTGRAGFRQNRFGRSHRSAQRGSEAGYTVPPSQGEGGISDMDGRAG